MKKSTDSGQNNLDQQPLDTAKVQFLLYLAEDGELKIDVRFEDDSVWLTLVPLLSRQVIEEVLLFFFSKLLSYSFLVCSPNTPAWVFDN